MKAKSGPTELAIFPVSLGFLFLGDNGTLQLLGRFPMTTGLLSFRCLEELAEERYSEAGGPPGDNGLLFLCCDL